MPNLINLIAWLAIGGVVGWIASLVMGTDKQQGILLNIVVGIVGAFLGGLLISPMVGTGTLSRQNFSMGAILIALLGAITLIGVLNFFRGRTARHR
jgi:uncharacterized membrane protein YeaQ/YmgE (transglycosylase-associated protein family)